MRNGVYDGTDKVLSRELAPASRNHEVPWIRDGNGYSSICEIKSWEFFAWKTFPLRMSSSPFSIPLFFLLDIAETTHPIPDASFFHILTSDLGSVSCIVWDCMDSILFAFLLLFDYLYPVNIT